MKELLTELFQNYHKDVYTYLYSMSHDASLSEDLTSEVFLDVVRSISSFRGESDIKTWIFSIARRKWFDHLRRKNREPRTESIHELCHTLSAKDHTGEDLSRIIDELLRNESAVTRQVFSMRLEGYSYFEIAAQCGISENSARVVFFRAKAKIRNQLEKEGFPL